MEGQLLKETLEEEDVEVKRRRGSAERGENVIVRRCGGVWEDRFTGGSVPAVADSDTRQEENEDAWQMQNKRKKRKKKKKNTLKQKDGIANGKNSFKRLRSKLRRKKEKKEEELFTARMVEEERQLVFQVGSGLPPVKEVVVLVPEGRAAGGEGVTGGGKITTPPPTGEYLKEGPIKDATVKTSWTLHPIQQAAGGRRREVDPDSSDYVDAAEVRRVLSERMVIGITWEGIWGRMDRDEELKGKRKREDKYGKRKILCDRGKDATV